MQNLNNRIEKRVSSLILFLCSNLLVSDEVWREIPGYDGDYFASNKGRILSLCRNEPRILKPFICSNEGNRTGYLYVELRGQKQRVHRLVALAFLEKVTSNDVSVLTPGKAQYSCFPNGKGGIVDDIIVYKFTDEKYLIVVNASNTDKDFAWIQQHKIYRSKKQK